MLHFRVISPHALRASFGFEIAGRTATAERAELGATLAFGVGNVPLPDTAIPVASTGTAFLDARVKW